MRTITHFVTNLALVLRSLIPLPMRGFAIQGTAAQTLLAMVFASGVLLGVDAIDAWPIASVEFWPLSAKLGFLFVITIAGLLAALVGQESGRAAELLVVAFLATGLGIALLDLWWRFVADADNDGGRWFLFVIMAAPTAVASARYVWQGRLRHLLPALAIAATLVGALWIGWHYVPHEPVFLSSDDTDDAEADYARLDIEALYLAQADLIRKQIDGLRPGTPGKTELFGLLVGGTAHQSVFASEVEKTGAILRDRFGAEGHLLSLVNSDDTPMALPMANRANIRAALGALAERMNTDEDVALLFLTSHGGKEIFALSHWQAGTKDMSSAEFAAMLDESGLRNLVIVLSACYAGSFIDDIQAPDRLVITAAAADRTSFGCSDNVEWTWFGQAFFKEALAETRDFRSAYAIAAARIKRWEWFGLGGRSNPQMWQGGTIGPVLDRLLSEKFAQAEN